MDLLLALLASIVAAAIPTLLYVGLAWWLDRYEREPLWLLSVTFLWGAIPAIIVSLFAEIILDIPVSLFVVGDSSALFSAAVVAPVVEEVAKSIPLVGIYFLHRREFDGLMDGLIYGALVGFGFAMTENVFYFVGAYAEAGWEAWGVLVFMRAIVFGLNHALFTSLFGAALGYARYGTTRFVRQVAPALGLAAAILMHGMHNLLVSLPGSQPFLVGLGADYLGIGVWIVLMLLASRQERSWILEELGEEVADGLLPLSHARASARYRTRLMDRWNLLREEGFGPAHRLSLLHNAATELAIKKRQLYLHGDEHGTADEIQRLRLLIRELMVEIG